MWDGAQACESFEIDIWDRESKILNDFNCVGTPCPPTPLGPMMCHSSNVIDFYSDWVEPESPTAVLGSSNELATYLSSFTNTESGMATIEFPDAEPTTPLLGPSLAGMPVVGFAAQRFTNAGAAEGLLAQYGALFHHKYKVRFNLEQ